MTKAPGTPPSVAPEPPDRIQSTYFARRRRLLAVRRFGDVFLPFLLVSMGATALDAGQLADRPWPQALLGAVFVTEAACWPHRFALGWLSDVRLPRGAGQPAPSGAAFVLAWLIEGLGRLALVLTAGLVVVAAVRATPWWPVALWLACGSGAALVSAAWPSRRGRGGFALKPLDDSVARLVLAPFAGRVPPASLPPLMTTDAGAVGPEGAHLAGFGRRSRIVLGADVLAEGPEVVSAVVAHELAHRQAHHPWWSMAMYLAELGAVLAVVQRVAGAELGDPSRFPLWAAVAVVLAEVASLGSAWLSRRQELSADRGGARLLGSFQLAADVLAAESARLGGERMPPPWVRLWSPYPLLDRRLERLALGVAAEEAHHAEQRRAP